MNISSLYDLQSIIIELEKAYQMDGSDFEETDVNVIISNVKKRIDRQYQVDLVSYKVDAVEQELGQQRNAVAIFIGNVTRIHASLCGYMQVQRYACKCEISMRTINYLGCTEETITDLMTFLQRKKTVPSTVNAIEYIKDKMSTVNTCWEKRLIMLMIISNAIGFDEVAAAIAELLYTSMVV